MKLVARSIILMFSLTIGSTIVSAQSAARLDGRILDAQGASIAGALVTLYARDRSVSLATVTNEAGAYVFRGLASGEYLLEVEAAGFARATRTVSLSGDTTLDVKLEPAGVSASVIVSATDAAQTIDEVAKSVSVVDRQELEERDEIFIAEALRRLPGLRVQQLGTPGALTSIKIRGLRNQDTAVLLDGFRLRDPSSPQADATTFLSDLLVTDVSRVEVLRGSGSSIYGTNAIGGVVQIMTDDGGGPMRGELLAEGGSLGLFRSRAQFAGGSGDDRLIYSFGIGHLNIMRGLDRDDRARNTSAQGRAQVRFTPNVTLSARLYAADSFLQLNESPQAVGALPPNGIIEAVPLSLAELRRYEAGTPISQLQIGTANFIPQADDPDNSQAQRFLSGAMRLTARLRDGLGVALAYQALDTRRIYRDGPAGVSPFEPRGNTRSDYDGLIHTFDARADWRPSKSNFVIAGYEFESENFRNSSFQVNPADNFAVDVTERSHAFYAQDQFRLLDDQLQLLLAFRAQFFSLERPKFEPIARAPYQNIAFEAPPNAYTGDGAIAYVFRSTGTKLRAHVGNGYRAPSLYERFGASFSSFFGYSVYGDPRLRPERSISVDGGLDQTFLSSRIRASATYFYTRLQETIEFDFSGAINPATDPFGRFGGYLNRPGGIARGVELSAETSVARSLSISAAYTYTNSIQRTPQVAGSGVIRSLVIPAHQFNVLVTQRFARRLTLNFDLAATSSYLAPIYDPNSFTSRVYRFRPLVKADLVADYAVPLSERKMLRLFGVIENLLDRDNYESGFRTPGRTARAGASLSF
jgi:iron complex outermembrane receptor protein